MMTTAPSTTASINNNNNNKNDSDPLTALLLEANRRLETTLSLADAVCTQLTVLETVPAHSNGRAMTVVKKRTGRKQRATTKNAHALDSNNSIVQTLTDDDTTERKQNADKENHVPHDLEYHNIVLTMTPTLLDPSNSEDLPEYLHDEDKLIHNLLDSPTKAKKKKKKTSGQNGTTTATRQQRQQQSNLPTRRVVQHDHHHHDSSLPHSNLPFSSIQTTPHDPTPNNNNIPTTMTIGAPRQPSRRRCHVGKSLFVPSMPSAKTMRTISVLESGMAPTMTLEAIEENECMHTNNNDNDDEEKVNDGLSENGECPWDEEIEYRRDEMAMANENGKGSIVYSGEY